ncbi:MAG: hypothetical protein GOMPHAMPRED_004125 [Gomphillus americanus]|uniref:DUF7924 domain-containing protein n=1 Tax=Gomphillus americanus TaxID=1940652 RepID=A0A8H3FKU4_9LECA|nr:MAG: hypothetical protein GOMPHAMPRED_004125 [Gomphillus americanus]
MYVEQLELKGFYMRAHSLGPNAASVANCKSLLRKKPTLPKDTRFADHLFTSTFDNVRDRNETRVIRDLAELIVPSAEDLCSRGELTVAGLIESVNEGWSHTEPITAVRPQPDFSVGFRRVAFTEQQLLKIRPILGDSRTQVSRFRATWYMYFPFLSCEVKCGMGALDIADRQNAHSMGIAVRAVTELFRLGGRGQEVDRKILAFSISHDDSSVRIYGYYPVIQLDQITYHRHRISGFDMQAADGKDRWTAYKFVKSVYQTWVPSHLERIRSVLDELPEDITRIDVPPAQHTGLSQQIGDSHISTSDVDALEEPENDSPSPVEPIPIHTPETSLSAIPTIPRQRGSPRRASGKRAR